MGLVRDRGYVARPVADVPLFIVASPALLHRTGEPDGLEALSARPLSFLIDRKIGRPWPWLFAQREHFHPESAFFSCDDAETELDAVLAGLVYGQLPGYLALPYLRDGRLIAVCRSMHHNPGRCSSTAHSKPPSQRVCAWSMTVYCSALPIRYFRNDHR